MDITLSKENRVKYWLLAFAACFLTNHSLAVTIELPEEELAKESVLPVFEGGTLAVKSRRVVTKEKFEVGPMVGMIFNEPFFAPMAYGIHAGYHLNEFHSFAVNAFMRDNSISDDARQVDKDLANVQIINFPVVPVPEYLVTVDYQLTPYYGKISLTKDYVMNLALYIYGGLGATDLGGKTTWIADLGVGQNLFITPKIGIRLDMKFLLYNGLNVTSRPNQTSIAQGPVDPSIFDDQFNVSPSVMLGVVFLL
jgi:outer membrane beta-barrel protein